jgi:hypothetical protein
MEWVGKPEKVTLTRSRGGAEEDAENVKGIDGAEEAEGWAFGPERMGFWREIQEPS